MGMTWKTFAQKTQLIGFDEIALTGPVFGGDTLYAESEIVACEPSEGGGRLRVRTMNAISPGYFETMGIRLLEGRDFRPTDAKKGDTVAIVNRQFAEHFFPAQSAVGRHIGFGTGPKSKLNIEIVGVAENTLYEGPREGVHRQVFVPNWGRISATFYLRTTSASSSAFNLIRNEVRGLSNAMPVYELKTLESQLDETLLTDRLIAMLSAGFGLLATVLASIGLYGVMAFVVARRSKELGLRMHQARLRFRPSRCPSCGSDRSVTTAISSRFFGWPPPRPGRYL